MRIKNLNLVNIGPFKKAELEFISEDTDDLPIICITGENGTGKSIIIDAIRALFNGVFRNGIERDITSNDKFEVKSEIILNDKHFTFTATKKTGKNNNALVTNNNDINQLFVSTLESTLNKDFIFDYWTSKLSNDSFNISNITSLEIDKYLDNSISGIHKNVELTKVISFFDYLKDSKNKDEKELGQSLYNILEEIINLSISNGSLSHVSRINLQPIIKVGNNEISLDKLSSGNLYLIQRFASLLSQVYAVCSLNNIPINDYKQIKGILLIDEAENHLHPKWQKVFLKNIQKLFPKLQIIVSTHSPFIVSSISNCRVFVCKSKIDYSIIEEETDFYSNKPIEEVLLSPLFDTRNFNSEISKLLELRKEAVNKNNKKEIKRIEDELLRINPEYFDYLNLDSIIKSIKK
ncbi:MULTISPECIES: AAA family ATPase [unclassified Cellulophaga]|uniref:AAA family ATPase n=1 Tax=unclassified Cellulophaga TaxID=2634405 RepID=UPI00131C79D8|nr:MULTISPECIES: AAA family ATPase [unclassified Cellulophaga]QXP52491.1 AAA family ATPase [Cellulophaga sp. HaHa_2_1]